MTAIFRYSGEPEGRMSLITPSPVIWAKGRALATKPSPQNMNWRRKKAAQDFWFSRYPREKPASPSPIRNTLTTTPPEIRFPYPSRPRSSKCPGRKIRRSGLIPALRLIWRRIPGTYPPHTLCPLPPRSPRRNAWQVGAVRYPRWTRTHGLWKCFPG